MALNNFVKPLLELPSEPVYNQTKEKEIKKITTAGKKIIYLQMKSVSASQLSPIM